MSMPSVLSRLEDHASTLNVELGGTCRVDGALIARVHELWDALADFPESSMDEALRYLLAELCRLFDASAGYWAGATRAGEQPEALGGWRLHGLRLVTFADGVHSEAPVDESIGRELSSDLTFIHHMERAGQEFRASRWSDLVSPDWFESDFYRDHYARRQLADAVYVGFPLSDSSESVFSLMRTSQQPAFNAQERAGIGFALRGIKRFHRHLMLSHGLLVASSKLTNTERRVLQQLLTGHTEKEVAAALVLSYHTTHAHVASILKKFGASNRPGLMSLWLSPTV